MKLLLSIALTLLRAKLRQSIVAAVGVMFSITMFVTLLGFMNGLNDLLDGLILNRTPHIRLYNELQASPTQPIDAYGTTDRCHTPLHPLVKPKDELPRLRNARPSWTCWKRTLACWPYRRAWWPRCSSTWARWTSTDR
jgi:lipoprotein-releasing system permease protein